jgi:hypothetical protein
MNTLKHTTYNKTISYVHVATHEVTGSQCVNSNTTHIPTRQIHLTYVTANPGQLSLQHSGFSLQFPLLTTVKNYDLTYIQEQSEYQETASKYKPCYLCILNRNLQALRTVYQFCSLPVFSLTLI